MCSIHRNVVLLAVLASVAQAARVGDFNAAEFGAARLVSGDPASFSYAPEINDAQKHSAISVPAGQSIQIEWRHPRDVHAVGLVFDGAVPKAEEAAVAWWYHIWPDNGGGGWMKLDDPFNGRFVTARAEAQPPGPDRLFYRFQPLEKTEVPRIEKTGADWRTTYKIRVTFSVAVRLAEVECLTDSRWKQAEVRIELPGQTWDGRVEPRNARVESVNPLDPSTAVVRVRYADNPERLSPDRGLLVVRRDKQGTDFSFFVDDVIHDGVIKIRDPRAVVSDQGRRLTSADWRKPVDAWETTVAEKVGAIPEQTYERAMREIPPKWIPPAHLGLPNLRQEISIDDRSLIFTEFRSLRSPGPDTDRAPKLSLDNSQRRYLLVTRREEPFGPPAPKAIDRRLEYGYLPIVHSGWEREGVRYQQVIFVTALDPAVVEASLALPEPAPRPIGEGIHAADFGRGPRGDEPVAALARLEMENPSDSPQSAGFWLRITGRPSMRIDSDGMLILQAPTKPVAAEGLTPIWGQIDTRGRGELSYRKDFFPKQETGSRDIIRYALALGPREKHAIVLKVPYVEQLNERELVQLRGLDFEASHQEVARLWKQRLGSAIEHYRVPEPALMNLYRANLWHVLITTDRDPPTGLYMHGAGTYDYPVYPNETMMVARSLEMRGEHEEARRMIEPCLVSQGLRPLPGNFKSQEGLLYAVAPKEYDHYTAQGYNMHHGFILWAAAEHYLWTRDRAYLDAVAPKLVAGCDWITRERQATKALNPDGSRPIEWGLAPAGDLEDVEEYLYWYATNAYYYLGMRTTARVLAEIGHPEAGRIAADAEAYAADIMASVRESIATSPVVRLLDGHYIPFVPSRAYALTDRKEGWIREALYCSLHLLDCELVRLDDPLVKWVLDGLEDRVFMSSESGYGPEDGHTNPREQFFSYGGFNPQPNLLDNSIAYLKRGQLPHFLRAFWNTYGISIYPDIECFAESCSYGMGGGPLYKTPDECKFIQWMRLMLVMEMEDELWLGRGIPKAWLADGKTVELRRAATYFGPMDLKISSAVSRGEVRAEIRPPVRNPPESIRLFLRHPDGASIRSVVVNGRPWPKFDASAGTVDLPPREDLVTVIAGY